MDFDIQQAVTALSSMTEKERVAFLEEVFKKYPREWDMATMPQGLRNYYDSSVKRG